MRTSGFAAIALFATLASGQSDQQLSERVFNFTHAESSQAAADIAGAIQIVSEVKFPEVVGGKTPTTLTVRGTDEQIRLAEWLFLQLDQSDSAVPATSTEYHLSGSGDNVVRIFYIRHAANVFDLRELSEAIHNTVDSQLFFTDTALNAIVARGTEDQMALAEWLVEHMDRPGSPPLHHSATPSYTTAEVRHDNTVRIFFAAHTSTIYNFQGMATAIRVVTQVRRMFTYRMPRAVAIRGTPDQIALAQWLFDALDQLPQSQPSSIERRGIGSLDIVRVFYFPSATTVEDFQKIATQTREELQKTAPWQIRPPVLFQLGTSNDSKAVVVRGTVGQIAAAETIIKETTPGF